MRRAEEDAVHRMRVATRRARSALKSFGDVLDRTATDPLGAELKWLAAVLGAERDREVLAERLDRRLADLDPALRTEPLRARLRDPHRADTVTDTLPTPGPRRTALLRALDGARYFALLDASTRCWPCHRTCRPPPPPAAEAARRHRATATTAGCAPPWPPRSAHAARPGPRHRPARRPQGRQAGPVLRRGRRARARRRRAAAHTARMKSVQQLLGEHQDSVMCRAALAALRGRADAAGEDPAPYDAMARAEHRIADGVEARVPDAWRGADRGL